MEKVRRLYVFDVLEILREDGIVVDDRIVDSAKFISRCHILGFKPDVVASYLW